jgi:hypothetical protein
MKKITLSLLALFSLGFTLEAEAQQNPQYTQYMYNEHRQPGLCGES